MLVQRVEVGRRQTLDHPARRQPGVLRGGGGGGGEDEGRLARAEHGPPVVRTGARAARAVERPPDVAVEHREARVRQPGARPREPAPLSGERGRGGRGEDVVEEAHHVARVALLAVLRGRVDGGDAVADYIEHVGRSFVGDQGEAAEAG